MNDKVKRRVRRSSARKHRVVCPCGRVGCETGRGVGLSERVLKRRDIRRGSQGGWD